MTYTDNPFLTRIKIFGLLTFLLAVCPTVQAQEAARVIPSSPEQAAINKFGDIPVGYSTGVPNISVPLYTITTKNGLKIPIQLSYHASGIKVDDVASNVGLGWALQAGYSISVSTNGLNDLKGGMADGSMTLIDPIDFDPNNGTTYDTDYVLASGITDGIEDGQPDIYSYNMGSRSGKFVLDQNPNGSKAHTIPFEPIDISIAGSGFNIKDEYGNLYKYNVIEKQTFAETGSGSGSGHVQYSLNMQNMPATYYLSEIVTNDGEVVNFSYLSNGYSYDVSKSEKKYFTGSIGCAKSNDPINTGTLYTDGYYLKSITFQGGKGKVEFNYSTSGARGTPSNNRLSSIKVKENGVDMLNYTLGHSEFNAGSGSGISRYRLKLLSVTETLANKVWSFGYNEQYNLPARFSYSQDFWGYFNGKSNSSLIPAYKTSGNTIVGGANRSVDENRAQAGILNSITYPTGGSTLFEYESNTYFGYSHETGTTTNHKTGGLRVKKITDKSASGDPDVVKRYTYSKFSNSSQSSGYAQDRPIFASELVIGSCDYITVSSSQLFTLGGTSGSTVTYVNVTVTEGSSGNAIGKTEYTYSLFNDYLAPMGYKVTSNAHKRGLLKNTKLYNSSGQVVRELTNNYGYDHTLVNQVYNDFSNYSPNYILAGLTINKTKEATQTTLAQFDYGYYFIASDWVQLLSTTVNDYTTTGGLITSQVTNYQYGNASHQQITRMSTVDSQGDSRATEYSYPQDNPSWHSSSNITGLIGAHRIATVLEERSFIGSQLLGRTRTHYIPNPNNTGYFVPSYLQVGKSSNTPETRLNFHSYDAKGNLLEVSKDDGTHTTYLYGYNYMLPIAEINNATFSQVSSALSSEGLSITTLQSQTGSTLETSLNKLRTNTSHLKNARVNSFTYLPLKGMERSTDFRGRTTTYVYDPTGRLQLVKDHNGKIMKAIDYEFKSLTITPSGQ